MCADMPQNSKGDKKEIKKEELSSFSAVRLFNAMIGWGAIEFPVANVSD